MIQNVFAGGENIIRGHYGDDALFGGPEIDYIDGGEGNDVIYG